MKKTINIYVLNVRRDIYKSDLSDRIKKLIEKLPSVSLYMVKYTDCISYLKQILKNLNKINEIMKMMSEEADCYWRDFCRGDYFALESRAKQKAYEKCVLYLIYILYDLMNKFEKQEYKEKKLKKPHIYGIACRKHHSIGEWRRAEKMGLWELKKGG